MTLTPAELTFIHETLASWPGRWFEAKEEWNDDRGGDGRYKFVRFEQIDGPTFGLGFYLFKRPDGFEVSYGDELSGLLDWPLVSTLQEALTSIEGFIRGKIAPWTLAIAA